MILDAFQGAKCSAVGPDGQLCQAPAAVIDGTRQDDDVAGFAVFHCVFSCESHWWLDIGQGEYDILVRIEGGGLYFASSKNVRVDRTKVMGEPVHDRLILHSSDGARSEVEKAWVTKVSRRDGKVAGLTSAYYLGETGQVDPDMPLALEYDNKRDAATCTAVMGNGALCREPVAATALIRQGVDTEGFIGFSCVFACEHDWQTYVDDADNANSDNL